jgi:hypothetical protein
MAKTSTLSIGINAAGDGAVLNLGLTLAQNAASPAQHQLIALASGANTLTPPTGTLYCVIVPPAASAVTKTVKGVTGDTGLPISMINPTLLSLVATPAAFVLTASAIETIEVYWL